MKTMTKEILANRIYGEDAVAVLDFLETVAPDKHLFRTETTFLNFVAKKLYPLLRKEARKNKNTQNYEFWNNRAMSMDITRPINKKKNVLWCIRLLNGKCESPKK